jgi:hypothetical protein
VVHPVGAHRNAIVCNDNQFLSQKGLVQQLLLYPYVQSIYIIVKESQKQGRNGLFWNDELSMGSDFSSPSSSRDIECMALDSISASFQVDAVFMLDDCKGWKKDFPNVDYHKVEEEDHETEHSEGLLHFWWERLSSESGSLVTCLGETLPLHHPFAWNIHQERMEMIQALDDAMFEKIVEYDIRLPN